ncbi:MAG TPA: T9SS type A sorting domain-containing protein, partial [Candidatus Marinimicrobia bacterium]|nr:T9SS type A sorting domain-containing protein [Candidatus Neomarinimicrobiota bacterium]
NPFNSQTKISYYLPRTGKVTIKVFDLNSCEVATLVWQELQKPGYYEVSFDASKLSSGLYFYQLSSEHFTDTRKMLLLK